VGLNPDFPSGVIIHAPTAWVKIAPFTNGGHMLVRVAIAIVLLLLLTASQAREKRIALLVGNQAYANEIGRLANPHNDVALLETALGCPEPGWRLPAQ
jgi:hypothetical protein